jgi:hypothetical protein
MKYREEEVEFYNGCTINNFQICKEYFFVQFYKVKQLIYLFVTTQMFDTISHTICPYNYVFFLI